MSRSQHVIVHIDLVSEPEVHSEWCTKDPAKTAQANSLTGDPHTTTCLLRRSDHSWGFCKSKWGTLLLKFRVLTADRQ